MYRKCDEIWACSFLRYASEQTDEQTNKQTHRRSECDTSHHTGSEISESFIFRF